MIHLVKVVSEVYIDIYTNMFLNGPMCLFCTISIILRHLPLRCKECETQNRKWDPDSRFDILSILILEVVENLHELVKTTIVHNDWMIYNIETQCILAYYSSDSPVCSTGNHRVLMKVFQQTLFFDNSFSHPLLSSNWTTMY